MLTRGHSAVGQNTLVAPVGMVMLKGLLRSLLLSGGIILMITMVMFFTPLPELIVPYIVVVGMLLSIIYGSMYVGRKVNSKGWLRGGITGLLYIVVVVILSYLFQLQPETGLSLLSRLFLGFSFGCIGGILGINS